METETQLNHSSPLISIEGLTKDFRGLRALDNINLHLVEKEILGVIGPNGAGGGRFSKAKEWLGLSGACFCHLTVERF